jgi:hypothetical protein
MEIRYILDQREIDFVNELRNYNKDLHWSSQAKYQKLRMNHEHAINSFTRYRMIDKLDAGINDQHWVLGFNRLGLIVLKQHNLTQ